MDELEITPSQLRSLAHELDAAAKAIQYEVQALEVQLNALSLLWSGEAQLAFQAVHDRFSAQMRARVLSLKGIALAAGAAGDGYGETDRAAARPLGGQ